MSNIKEAINKSKNKSKALTTTNKSVVKMIEDRKELYAGMIPSKYDVNRFISASLMAIQMNPKLQQCSAKSVLKAIGECARYGLEPNSPLSEAALVPYGSNVEFLIEYRGLLKLAWNSGLIKCIEYDKICENDTYEYTKGFNSKFEHKPLLVGERGETIAYYAYAEIVGGGHAMVLMSTDEIKAHGKQFSKSFSYKSSPWQTDFDAMAVKTVIRQLLDKKCPKGNTSEAKLMQQAVHFEDFPIEQREQRNKLSVQDPKENHDFYVICDQITALGGDPQIVVDRKLSDEDCLKELKEYRSTLED
jgi:recombination protein RecT